MGTALRLALPSLPEEGQACCMILKGSLGEKAESHVAEAGLRLLRQLKTTVNSGSISQVLGSRVCAVTAGWAV